MRNDVSQITRPVIQLSSTVVDPAHKHVMTHVTIVQHLFGNVGANVIFDQIEIADHQFELCLSPKRNQTTLWYLSMPQMGKFLAKLKSETYFSLAMPSVEKF